MTFMLALSSFTPILALDLGSDPVSTDSTQADSLQTDSLKIGSLRVDFSSEAPSLQQIANWNLRVLEVKDRPNWLADIQTTYLKNPGFWIRGGLIVVGAAAEGYAEVLRTHYASFKRVHPNAKDDYWDPAESWKKKWKNGDPEQGEKFFMSSGLLSPVTDGLHLMKGLRNLSFVTAIVIPIGRDKRYRKSFHEYAFEAGSCLLFYQLGFSMIYDHIYE